MRIRVVQLTVVALLLSGVMAEAAQAKRRAQSRRKPAEASLPCGNALAFQVLMDRAGFSSGPIDGQLGPNFKSALAAFQSARNLAVSGKPDCDTWQALDGDSAKDIVTEYTVTEADIRERYERQIPTDLNEQAKLPDLGYTSLIERLAERYHASPLLLRRLNSGKPFLAGRTVSVPNVEPFDAEKRPRTDPAAGDITIVVARQDSSLRAVRPDGSILFFAPVTTGSEHDPLPVGDWTVKGAQWHPPFHYNPDLFWDAKPEDTKATIKPGPNNPVGVVWIALNLEHYGLHGTPAPEQVGHTASHGCVRLTNWDAARVTALVKPGTPVQFR